MVYKTASSRETKKMATFLAKEILSARLKNSRAVVIALSGNLGSGKTTFVQGFLRVAGVKSKITSPTFIIVKRFKIKDLRFKNIYHIDCYRVRKSNELLSIGIKDILSNPQNIVLIEWPEKIKKYLPKNVIWIKFKYGEKENERIIRIAKKYENIKFSTKYEKVRNYEKFSTKLRI
ncbi:tRNA (adenosine(37)-N6)-threonylcarbamoyltransferase complex ATPase subunit type 1 TsaE [Candidatus Wolfebacteria bacterium]|nr:tRNA (adenosine(37)-N6)-threonylcarbamoyltransferase complex ATPase subunit type 1 TsaE [Candidatus Wolfebacteria bacterium]